MRFAELLRWRWTPAVALVGGSLLFVLLAVALVPDEIGHGFGSPSASARRPLSPTGSAAVPGSAHAGATHKPPRHAPRRAPLGAASPASPPAPYEATGSESHPAPPVPVLPIAPTLAAPEGATPEPAPVPDAPSAPPP
jgi:hypothetical protein